MENPSKARKTVLGNEGLNLIRSAFSTPTETVTITARAVKAPFGVWTLNPPLMVSTTDTGVESLTGKAWAEAATSVPYPTGTT